MLLKGDRRVLVCGAGVKMGRGDEAGWWNAACCMWIFRARVLSQEQAVSSAPSDT